MGLLAIELLRAATATKVVDSDLLNRLGLQVVRAVVAHRIHDRRRVSLRGAATHAQLRCLEEDGVVAISNFLPERRFERVRDEARALLEQQNAKVHQHGPNRVIQRVVNDSDDVDELRRLFDDKVLLDLFDSGERLPVDFNRGLRAVEELIQGGGQETDPETELHTDIFFPTHKGWLYLDNVTRENAPFVYVKGSHKMPRARLSYEYADSCAGNRRSRRVTPEELERRNLVETVFEVAENTLVVANTCGYHRRLLGTPGCTRRGVHFSHRRNPFLPRFKA